MGKYTVIGLWVEDEPVVAGVIEGEHPAVDSDPFDSRFRGRWMTSVDAEGPAEAEIAAVAELEDSLLGSEELGASLQG